MYTLNLDEIARFDLANALHFVDFWSKFDDSTAGFDVTNEGQGKDAKIDYFAELNLGNEVTEENLRRLLRWKDPRFLSPIIKSGPNKGEPNPKVEKVLNRRSVINRFRKDEIGEAEMRAEADKIFPSGPIWRFLLLHIAKPVIYPLADENVLEAWSLHTRLSKKKPYTWQTYDAYRSYFGQIAAAIGVAETTDKIRELKRIDGAILAFGRFLMAYCPSLGVRPTTEKTGVVRSSGSREELKDPGAGAPHANMQEPKSNASQEVRRADVVP